MKTIYQAYADHLFSLLLILMLFFSASCSVANSPVDKIHPNTKIDIPTASQFVVVDQSEPEFIVFTGIPRKIYPANLEKIKQQVADNETLTMLTWKQFLDSVDGYARSVMLRNDYPNIRIIDGLICLLASERCTGSPWGLTWNGGIALTYNDYQHARETYQTFKTNPQSYKPVGDPRGDPINPNGHLPFCGCMK